MAGFSENAIAAAPSAAQRSISATASAGSRNGSRISGIRRPGTAPHHSSSIQSLYARRQASPSSWSSWSENSWPQNRGNDGKHNDDSTWLRSMGAASVTTRRIDEVIAMGFGRVLFVLNANDHDADRAAFDGYAELVATVRSGSEGA